MNGLEARKEDNLSEWYSQMLFKAEMIENSGVDGCYIMRPGAYAIWEHIKHFFDFEIKKLGVENCYFPVFISNAILENEKERLEEYYPELQVCATRTGVAQLQEPLFIRATSEPVMYPAFSKWIKSYRDLPLKLNQWCNAVRWESKWQPFLRTREFLWQEGHTAFDNYEEAEEEVYTILELYARVYEELLAVPVISGRKSKKETFPGAEFTTSIEAFIPTSGRAIQAASSHHLGQIYARANDVFYEDDNQETKLVLQNCWGLTTRSIGVVCMVHGDNMGLVLPPKVASYQVVIVPCGIAEELDQQSRSELMSACVKTNDLLLEGGIRSKADLRDYHSPEWKSNHWQLKGIPVRIEISPCDLQQNQFVAVRRDTGERMVMENDMAIELIQDLLSTIQQNLFDRAKNKRDDHLTVTYEWIQFLNYLNQSKIIQVPFCGEVQCEENIIKDSARGVVAKTEELQPGAKSLCIPLKQPEELELGTLCIHPDCQNTAKYFTLFGRSY